MKDIIDLAVAISITLSFGYGAKKAHDVIRYEVLKTISQGLSPSEGLANALTGEKLDF